jgi:hypothetical protein
MFGVALGFWISTIHHLSNWSLPLIISVLLTLAVVICVYWWYVSLCSLYPSRTLFQYAIDFMIVIGLCSMSKSCGDPTQFLWIVAWGSLAAVASIKLWFCVGELRNNHHSWLVWPPRIAAPVICLLALYSAMLTYDNYVTGDTPNILVRVLTWGPVAAGIIVTFVIACIHSHKISDMQNICQQPPTTSHQETDQMPPL